MDPWLIGSSYWRSWWNFPPVKRETFEHLKPDYIYLTHIHWDHFQGPSLRFFGKETTILIPEDRYDRMLRDLKSMGFKNVIELPHGREFRIGEDFTMTPFTFFPMTDSAVILQGGGTTLFNANDCKIAGLPLKQVLDRHPRIDFAFRSHSSANSRVCHTYLDSEERDFDSTERYLRSFSNFMAAVRPRFAVPFASNHCHLHKDTLHYNSWAQSPRDVKQYFDRYREENGLETELVIMLPGSQWSDQEGFTKVAEMEWFDQRVDKIREYGEENREVLDEYYEKEARTKVSDKNVEDFFGKFFEHLIYPLRRRLKNKPIFIKSCSEKFEGYWKVDTYRKKVEACSASDYENAERRIEIPPLILRQALGMNMFYHAALSKRVQFYATRRGMPDLVFFENLLMLEEYEMIPLRNHFSLRSFSVWLRRWREVLLFLNVLWIKFKRKVSLAEVEQILLLEQSR